MSPTGPAGGGRGSRGGPPWEEYRPPIRVEGGLTARSARGRIGDRWWSRRFIEVLESFSLGTRLTRGRAYARQGQVLRLDVAPGAVEADVQGSRVRPYRVRIGLPPFSRLVWAKVEIALAEQAIHSAQLLAGEFPPELEEVFTELGSPLFPQALTDLELHCSCPDQVVPCKHLAATCYLLAERFDEDPFLILAWRGRDRQTLLSTLRELRGEDGATTGAAAGPTSGADGEDPAPAPSARAALAGLAALLPPTADVEGFWAPGPPPPAPPRPDLPVDLLLRQLPTPPPELGGARLVTRLRPLYLALPADAQPTDDGPA